MQRIKNAITGLLSSIGSLIFILFIIVMWSANIKSCFTTEDVNVSSKLADDIKIIEASPENPIHKKLLDSLTKIYSSLDLIDENSFDARIINDSSSLNAASFGNGRYLFWETLADLPEWAIDSIVAHEVAHDMLLHSRKMQDLNDVRNFFTDVLALFGGADRRTEKTLHDWSSKLTLPRYSQKQEYEADQYAVEILYACDYDSPNKLFANTLKYIKKRYGNTGGGFFDYHPSTDDRIQTVLSLN